MKIEEKWNNISQVYISEFHAVKNLRGTATVPFGTAYVTLSQNFILLFKWVDLDLV